MIGTKAESEPEIQKQHVRAVYCRVALARIFNEVRMLQTTDDAESSPENRVEWLKDNNRKRDETKKIVALARY